MTHKLWTVRVTLQDGSVFLVGNFVPKWRAEKWARKAQTIIACETSIEPGAHSLCGPRDFETFITE